MATSFLFIGGHLARKFHCHPDFLAFHAVAGPCSEQRALSLCPASKSADLKLKM